MRHLLPVLVALITLAPAQTLTAAERAYPVRPVRLIVPYSPGGGSDITGRAIGNKLTEYLGQTFIIDNRPGATGLIGTVIAARAPADGYTIILADAPHTINSLVYAKPPYDAIRDFTPLNLIATSPQALLANPKFSANTLKELLAMPRAQTEKLSMGSSGLASGPHLAYEWLRLRSGLTLNHVPYKGGGPSLADGAAGQIPLVMNAVPAIPTISESGIPGYNVDQMYGIIGSAKIPKPIIMKINAGIVTALKDPENIKKLNADGSTPVGSTPEEYTATIRGEVDKWRKLAKAAKLELHSM